MATVIHVSNETTSQSTRVTREGRKITYRLDVIQQPERARACGSGAKSSSDRRPVDPPPIVELRVFEGEGANMQDITFPYSANFFLFATLENARTMAQGRLPTAASFPVLTGTPVAGMAYLDRPNPAGYFIFPDLSVRHEGKYRLSFALYEELKEQKDMDTDVSNNVQVKASGIDAYVTHRLEVKSAPFTVFSAKKFPGLTESTQLSRLVAEQGCRVRIRRDVRMRRRDTKGGEKWDEYEDEAAREHARRTATPNTGLDQSPERPPSAASNPSAADFAQRRPSMQEMNQGYPQSYSQPMGPPQHPPQSTYQPPTPYSNTTPYANHYPPQPQPPPNVMQPPQNTYQSSAPTYQQPHQPQQMQPQHMAPMPQPQYGYLPNQGYPQNGYESQPHARPESGEYHPHSATEYRRPSIPQPQHNATYPPVNGMVTPYSQQDNSNRPPQVNQPPQMLHMPSLQPTGTRSAATSQLNGQHLAPLKTEKLAIDSPTYQLNGAISASPNDMHFGSSAKYAPQTPQIGGKRAYSETFDTKHLNQPLRQGARPAPLSEDANASYDNDSDDVETFDVRAMEYRRADGSQRTRRIGAQS